MNRPQPPRRTGLTLAQDVAIDTYRRVWRIADDSGFDDCWEPEANPAAGSADMDWEPLAPRCCGSRLATRMYGTRPLTVWRRIEGEVSRQVDGRSAEDRRRSIPREQPDDL